MGALCWNSESILKKISSVSKFSADIIKLQFITHKYRKKWLAEVFFAVIRRNIVNSQVMDLVGFSSLYIKACLMWGLCQMV